jgi:hypothetical protein
MSGRLLAFDYASRQPTVLAEGLAQADGIAPAGQGSYYVSDWPGRLFRVAPGGKPETLIDTRGAGIYINDFIRLGETLLVPHMKPGELVAYSLPNDPASLTRASRTGNDPPPVGPAVRFGADAARGTT